MTGPRIIGCDEDGSAIFAPRPFRATPTHDGYRVNGWKLYCKKCKTTTMSTVRLPHDLAESHECLYDPAQIERS